MDRAVRLPRHDVTVGLVVVPSPIVVDVVVVGVVMVGIVSVGVVVGIVVVVCTVVRVVVAGLEVVGGAVVVGCVRVVAVVVAWVVAGCVVCAWVLWVFAPLVEVGALVPDCVTAQARIPPAAARSTTAAAMRAHLRRSVLGGGGGGTGTGAGAGAGRTRVASVSIGITAVAVVVAESAQERRSVGGPLSGILAERSRRQRGEIRWRVRLERLHRGRRSVPMHVHERKRVVGDERQRARQHPEEDDAEGVDVARRSGGLSSRLLGRDVRSRAEHGSGLGQRAGSHRAAREPEVARPSAGLPRRT